MCRRIVQSGGSGDARIENQGNSWKMPQTIQGEISKHILTGVAMTILIFAVTVYMPIIGFFCSLLIPLPILFYRLKLGRANGAIVPAASILIMAILLGGVGVDMLFFVELMLIGFVLSEFMEMNLSVEKTVLYGCAGVTAVGLATLFFYSHMTRTGIGTLVSDHVGRNLDLAMALYRNMDVPEDNIRRLANQMENIRYGLVSVLPSLAVSSILFVIWTTLLIARPILKSKGVFYPDFGSLRLWKPPAFLVWVAIGCGMALLFPIKIVKFFALNGVIILMTIYFFGGIAIVSFYFQKKRFPLMLRFFLYSLIAFQQFVLLLVIGLGFFDLWLDFRKSEKL